MSSQARGLQNFISDLRNAKSKEEETRRVDKELANIRKKFCTSSQTFNAPSATSFNPSLSSYQRKKYVWKLVYIHVLGYDVDFGHGEVIRLVRSPKSAEKQVGYVALSLLFKSGDPLMSHVIPTLRQDLGGVSAMGGAGPSTSSDDTSQSLALCSIANIGGLELVQALHGEVQQLLISSRTTSCVKKKAALCLLRLVRSSPHTITAREFAPQVARLLQDSHLGVVTSVVSLLIGLASRNAEDYGALVPIAVNQLGVLVLKGSCERDYLYYRTPSPWLQIKLLRYLQLYPKAASSEDTTAAQLRAVVSKILNETDVSESINKSNADHAILFEAVQLIVAWGSYGPPPLREGAMRLLGKYISVREPNIRYLGLMTMAKLAQLENTSESIKKHQATVLVSLKDADISVRRRALDLLFVMCDTDNAERIVDELVQHLHSADAAIREEMVLKIAVLAEKYATDLRWYVDTVLKLITISGDHVSDSIWHRVVQIVTNHPQGDLQAYTAATLLQTANPRRCHETGVRVAAYVLGEFGFLVAEKPGMSGEDQFRILHQHWSTCGASTQALLISTYAKLANLYEECRPLVAPIFARHKNSVDVEIQQRSSEYAAMREAFSPEAVEDLLREMPPFEDRNQALEQRLQEQPKPSDEEELATVQESPSPPQPSLHPTHPHAPVPVPVQPVPAQPHPLDALDSPDTRDQPPLSSTITNGQPYQSPRSQTTDYEPKAPVQHFPDSPESVDNEEQNHVNNPRMPEMSQEPPHQQPQLQAQLQSQLQPQLQSQPQPPPSNQALVSTAPVGIPKEVIPAMRKAFSNLCTNPSGVLFENQLLQVGVKQEYVGSQGRISIFFGNLSSEPLTEFRAKIDDYDHLRMQKQGSPGLLEDGCTVAVRTQAKLLLLVEVTAPFDDAPAMRLSFQSSGKIHEYPLRLPIVATCFMEAVTLEPAAFMQRWRSLEGQERECQEVVKLSGDVTINEAYMQKISSIITAGLKFGRCQGCDPTPWTVSGAATFRTGAKDSNGNNINVGCLVRVEANPQAGAFRVTTRTLHPLCSKAVKNVALVSIKLA